MTADQAIAQARALAEQRGWPFLDEVRAKSFRPFWIGRLRWLVQSHHGHLGMSVRVELDDATGQVLLAGYLPR